MCTSHCGILCTHSSIIYMSIPLGEVESSRMNLTWWFGESFCLCYFDIHGCLSLKGLSSSVHDLTILFHLYMNDYQGIILGEKLSNYVFMERLSLNSFDAIGILPTSIGKLNWFHYLDMRNYNSLFRLPEESGNIVCLQ